MNASIVIRKGKGFEKITLPAPVDSFIFSALVEKNEAAASVMANLWDDVTKKYGEIDRVEITGFTQTRQIAGEGVEFPASATITNLNMTQMLNKLASWQEARRKVNQEFADVKALLKQAVSIELQGYEAGRRGRKAKQSLTKEQALENARKALGL